MSTQDSSQLVDEDDVRAAVRFFGIDRVGFGRGVRERVQLGERIHEGVQERSPIVKLNDTDSETPSDRSGLLRIAASVLPVNLLGGSTGATASLTTLTAVGGLKKTLAWIAMPSVSILMIVVTIGSLFRIRNAQTSERATDADVDQMNQIIAGWWRRYGWVAGIVFVLALVTPFFGWTTPLLLVFIASAIATTSLVVTLGRAGMVNRSTVGSYCLPILGLLGQLSFTFAMINQTALLDPMLATLTCFGGVGILALLVSPLGKTGHSVRCNWLRRIGFSAMCCIGVVLGSQTIWRHISNESIIRYAESFDPDLVGQWPMWRVSVDWLDDQEIQWDRTGVRSRFLTAIQDKDVRRYLFSTAVTTRLLTASELIEMPEVTETGRQLLEDATAGRSINGVGMKESVITVLAESGELSPAQTDHLSGRLMASWNELREASKPGRILEDADVITRMLTKLGRSPELPQRSADVRHWLQKYQVTNTRVFSPSGGFQAYYQPPAGESPQSCDRLATAAGVRLMEFYGQADAVDVLALRSYLRPSFDFGLVTDTEMPRAATLARLNRVPGISQPTVWDHLVRDRTLWFALLMVGLCLYATLGAPEMRAPEMGTAKMDAGPGLSKDEG